MLSKRHDEPHEAKGETTTLLGHSIVTFFRMGIVFFDLRQQIILSPCISKLRFNFATQTKIPKSLKSRAFLVAWSLKGMPG